MLPEGLILVGWAASLVGNRRSLQFAHFGFFFLCLDNFCENVLHHPEHIIFFGVWCLVLETLALVTLLDRGCSLDSSTLKIIPVFWHNRGEKPAISEFLRGSLP